MVSMELELHTQKSTHSAKLARINCKAHKTKLRCLFVLSVLEKLKLLQKEQIFVEFPSKHID